MTDSAPLWERDPVAWEAHLAEGNAAQARKRVSADVLIRDPAGRILLVKPTYKPGWDLPGGMCEANESPAGAARREINEELDIDIEIGRLLCVEWVPPHGPWDDLLAFVFDGGQISSDEAIHVDGREIASTEFFAATESTRQLRERARPRLTASLRVLEHHSNVPAYLQDGTDPRAA